MSTEKIIAEQQYGKGLYHKLKLDFKEELAQGIVVGPEKNLPKAQQRNIMAGIAFEALKEKDYRTAEAFFLHLGKKYKAWQEHADKLLQEDRREEKEPPKTLTEKITSIEAPKIKFEYAQEKIRDLGKKYKIVEDVLGGETTLEEIAIGYETELDSMCKLKKEEFKEQAKACSAKLIQLEEMLKEFTGLKLNGIDAIEDYKVSKIAKAGENILNHSTALLMLGGTSSCFVGVATANPLMIGLGFASLFSAIPAIFGAVKIGEKFGKTTERTCVKKMFSDLKKSCKKADKTIQEAFATDFYLKNPKIFKNAFKSLGKEEQRYVISKLLKQQKDDKKVDKWLEENYAEIIEEEGTANFCS